MADGFLERMESFRTRTRVRIKKWVLSAKTPGAWGQWFRLKAWRFVYDLLAYCYGGEILWTYMNYGYLPADGKLVTLDKDDNVSARVKNSDIYSIQLYHAVVSVVECEGKNLLEVGSGRGGGASYVSRYLKPKDVTGVELSSQAVQLANRIHKGVPNLHFVQGDACNLKNLPDNSYDVVFNVESSHCYPDFKKFLSEVHRVLTPGGYFVMADFRMKDDVTEMDADLRAVEGMTVIQREDISQAVFRSMAAVSQVRKEHIQNMMGRWYCVFGKVFEYFAGIEGSTQYRDFASGDIKYMRYALQKNK